MMSSADSTQKQILSWLDDVGITYTDGGVTGPALAWAASMSFGSTTHVSIAHDTRFLRRIEIISDLAIADDHKASYARLTKAERSAVDRRAIESLLRRTNVSFYIARDERGAPQKIAMRIYLPIEGLRPIELVSAIHEMRNSTMDLCVTFQDAFGSGSGISLEKALTDPGYANVVLHRGTLETLDAFQIPGETLDETILRAVRE